ncbi:MAG: flagellar basal body P-ring formation protein FlgA [Zoogloeaceae bacterium]|jgi:flagella basal body P-ring formation protein FlgA|nr:flagellar basal body P-ring formation protein FlgA [Zoogloeaceae bacterium]
MSRVFLPVCPARLLARGFVFLCGAAVFSAWAAEISHPALLRQAEAFVRQEVSQNAGFKSVAAGPLDARLRLPSCEHLQFFLPHGMDASRLMGQTRVGARCLDAAARWSVFIPVKIAMERAYLAAAVSLPAGRVLRPEDCVLMTGDPALLPAGLVSNSGDVIGKTLKIALQAGQPVRLEQLSAPILIQQGQTVRLIFQGAGFTASNEGKAMLRAGAGQVVQVKTASGIVVSGVAQTDGTVLVSP